MSEDKKLNHPKPFLDVRVLNDTELPPFIAMCAGYELDEWRDTQLVKHIMKWLPEFALKHSECQSLDSSNAVELIEKAAKSIYSTDKYKLRGEFGELILHIILRQVFKTLPAISKMYYKDSRNDTVKGFDCVHVVPTENGLQLWIGEVKFYTKIDQAIYDVVSELEKHTGRDYLRDEFVAITNKIDDSWVYAEKLKLLLDEDKSLDEIFDSISIPILLTYDSEAINNFSKITEEFKISFEKEVLGNWNKFKSKNLPKNISIYLILFPLKSKKDIQDKLHKELQKWN
jgi:hypothetical protein